MGFTTQTEANLLNSSELFGSTRYLRLLQWTGTAGLGSGVELNEDGTLPANVSEPSTGGYTYHQVLTTDWATVQQGAPTTKQWPKIGGTGVTYTPSGGASWDIIGYCWTSDTAAISSSNVKSSGLMVDQNGDPATVHVDGSHPLTFDQNFPIVERLGDPPPGVDPT